jgi:aryl-alcohol dehydrogenase-like predicted oxidoreductase
VSAPDFLHAPLGRTGRTVHRVGVASSFGVGGRDLEAAVEEHGLNYLYWGSRRTATFGRAIRALCARGLRDQLFVVVQSYSRSAALVRPSLSMALRRLGIEQADMLLLGWWNKPVSRRILDAARRCQERGRVKHLGVSTHQRPLVPGLMAPGSPFDVVHFRYNAANRGAERDIFPHVGEAPDRAGLVSFTATRWGQLLKPQPGHTPLSPGDCYRFVLSHPQVDVCMTGPQTGDQLQAALRAVAEGPFAPEALQRVEAFGDVVYAGGGVTASLGERF